MANKILFFGDCHIRDYGSFPPFNQVEENGLTKELNNILRGFDFVHDEIVRVKPIAVFLVGDLYHTPEGLSTTMIHAASIGLKTVKEACDYVGCKLYIIPGNHDCQNENLGIFSIANLIGYGEVITSDYLVRVPYYHQGKTIDRRDFRVGVVQFCSGEDKVTQMLNRMSKKCDFIVTHLDFQSALYENGFKSDSIIPTDYPVPVVSGDLHAQQRVGSVYYPGSLVQNRFTRNDLERVGGVLTFDIETQEFEHKPNTYSAHYVKIESEDDLLRINDPKFTALLQVKCEIKDKSVLDGKDYIYIPVKKTEGPTAASKISKINSGSPFSMFKRWVAEENPDAVSRLESVIEEKTS